MRFDIIIPTINRMSLNVAVESVYAQRHPDWRLFIVGDGVMPDIKSFDKEKTTITATKHRTSDSGASQRNFGIDISNSDWIAYLDDDDVWFPDHLSTITKLAEANPRANLFKTAAQEMVMTRKSPRHKKTKTKLRAVNTEDPLTITIAHSRELFYKTGGWQSVDNHDHILFNEMLSIGGTLIKTNNITALFLR